ncbi:MAG: SDR family NAD(P)-dependent oxidoreductase [Candidatus Omnitrophica bacterium]|nr:SDR family NAD(P)-dependent oxidoreductase [Candidatus Omnitrophota bacterium]
MAPKEKKVLVTGADGFIGSHLVEALVEAGYQVTAFCFYNSFGSWGWLDSLPKDTILKINVVTGDIRDPYGILKALEGIDIVFHLAALIGIPYSYSSPENYVDTNIKGTLNILQAARKHQTSRVLVTSTSEVYGTALYVPIDEKHPLQAQSPYSATKIAADRMAESFYRSFDLPVTIVRPFNTFGPRQSLRAVIPTIITQILDGNKVALGELGAYRDFNYVKDVCAAFIAIASSTQTIGEEINIASQKEISIGDLVNVVVDLISPQTKIKVEQDKKRLRPKKSEVMRLCGSRKKLEKLTGWKPEYSLESGLKETIEWVRNHKHLFKSGMYHI